LGAVIPKGPKLLILNLRELGGATLFMGPQLEAFEARISTKQDWEHLLVKGLMGLCFLAVIPNKFFRGVEIVD